MDLTHVRLLVDNYKESFLFYRDLLGFEVTWGDALSLYGQFKVGNVNVGLFERKQMAEAVGFPYSPDDHRVDRVALILKVESVEESYNELKEKVEFVTKPKEQEDWGIKVAHFRDIDGFLIEIYENL
ncbi:VOC family protein [Alkalihalophilus lindianensis]|uniref:VOC family protein n=1 Tax=Alkalihalophilus lindianensis TaxID=1630542 RepID=A0ABU3X974_9BACI|nr:VOC family protein [Alkalihalophilus lindianensis]MDV2684014.1 VOC family protein [Alkalihalophilus lindianensis]